MSRISRFDSPFLLGFDHLQRVVDRASKASGEGYPPFNIEEKSPDAWRITLAVAGFGEDDLSVTLENGELVVRGRIEKTEEKEFLHRGIATRAFQRSFGLADGVEVNGAALENGLLHVELKRTTIDAAVQQIEITSKK